MEPKDFCDDPKRPYCPGCRRDYDKRTGPGAKFLHEQKCRKEHPALWSVEPTPQTPLETPEVTSEEPGKPKEVTSEEPEPIGEAVNEEGEKVDIYTCPGGCGASIYEMQEYCQGCGKHLNWSE